MNLNYYSVKCNQLYGLQCNAIPVVVEAGVPIYQQAAYTQSLYYSSVQYQ